MKKTFIFSLMLVLFIIVLSGSAFAKTKIAFWDFHSEMELEYFENLVKEYNSIQDEVEIEFSVFNQSDYTTTKLPIGFANGQGPDIFMISPGDFMKFAEAGIMADLTPYYPDGFREDFLPSAIDAVTYKGQILAVPFELELLGLYYNKDMLNKAGIEVPKTWNELLDAARKLNTSKTAGIVLPTDKGPYFNFNWYPFLWQLGGSVLNEDGTKSEFASPEVAKALDFWGTFFKENLAPTKLQYGPWDIANIATGTAAMQICGTWAIPMLEKQYPDVNIGLAPLPIPEGGKGVTVAGGWKMAVNSRSDYVKEAAAFVMWVFAQDPSRPLEWATEIKFAYPARRSVVSEGGNIYNKGLRKNFTDFYDTAVPEPRFPVQITEPIGDAMQNVMFKNMTGAEAAEKANEKIEKYLQSK